MRLTTLAARSSENVHVGSPARLRLLAFATVILTLTRFGAYWDVQWHWAVGRDSFFIPPHDLIYSGVAISGLLGLWITWRDGWRHRFASVSLPWGWLIQMIGAGVTVSAAPFDDLWHRRYGIDVTIWSPPHMVGVLGAWTMHIGLFISWALVWRYLAKGRSSVLFALIWSATLVVSMFNFGLVPAMRWSVLQPVAPTLYSALGSLLIPAALIGLVWFTGKPWTVLALCLGLIALRVADQWLWNVSLRSVVPLFEQRPRRIDLSALYRHFWLHPILNVAVALAVFVGMLMLRGREEPWGAAMVGMLAGLATWVGVRVLATGRIVAIERFVDRGGTGRDFHAETDWLLGVLGTGPLAALGWALALGALSGLVGWVFARWLSRGGQRGRAWQRSGRLESTHQSHGAV